MSDWLLEWDDVAEEYNLADPDVYHDAWFIHGRPIDDTAPTNGDALIYRTDYNEFRVLPADLLYRLTIDRATAALAYSNVTGFSFAVEANHTYEFEFCVRYNLSDPTHGINLAVNGPAAPTSIVGHVVGCYSATLLAGRQFGAYDTGATFTAGIAGENYATVKGILTNGANSGYLYLRFATENVLGTATVKADSFVRYRKIN